MLKIDFYISSLSGGGAEKVLVSIAKMFAKKNDVTILSLEKRTQFYEVPNNIKLKKINHTNVSKFKENIFDFLAIRSNLKNNNAQISISFLSRTNMLILLSNITLFLKHKIIVCDRNNPLEEHSKFYFYMSCLLYNFASLICVQTYQIKSFYPKYLQNKIKVIENPLDSEALNAQIDIVPTREKRIISIGRLEPQKDFITLINAFSNILHTYPDWNLDIYGVGYMHEIINELINKKNLSQFVHLKGHTTKPFYELKKSSIFVLSSNYEGFPNVLCEAMYAEDICIASDCISGPKELIHHGENGWLFKIGDENELTKLLEKAILLHNSKEGKDLRISAHQTVKRLEINNIFVDWEKAVKEIID